MAWMGIWWVIGIALVVLLVWALARGLSFGQGADESPEQIVKRRYARGEIDRDTYERLLDDLKR